ncbi:DUF1173 family protein [Stackebrandtia soli]|uniref:DUF1173 family protein n=1 Tax=Stackebrandtia soli TaxID=1892856 RepID=UPI0039EAEFAB
MTGLGRIELAGSVVELGALRGDPGRYVALCRRARAEVGHGYCQCVDPWPRLVLRARNERFHVARWPGDADRHHPDCVFSRPVSALSGRGQYSADALADTERGVLVRLSLALTAVSVSASPARAAVPRTAGSRARGTMTLLGLLHYLWESAGLNTWRPGRPRTWSACAGRLVDEIGDVVVDGDPLAKHTFVVPPFDRTRHDVHLGQYREFATRLGGPRHRLGLIIGELDGLVPRRYSTQWRIRQLRDLVVYATGELSDRIGRSYPVAVPRLDAPPGERVRAVGVYAVTRNPKARGDHLTLHDAALMACTGDYVPIDSRHELTMAAALTAAGRRFLKPLRFDASRDLVLPDFVLTDEDPPRVVEVYGMTGNAAYDARTRAKRAHYAATGQALFEWDPTVSPELRVPRRGE